MMIADLQCAPLNCLANCAFLAKHVATNGRGGAKPSSGGARCIIHFLDKARSYATTAGSGANIFYFLFPQINLTSIAFSVQRTGASQIAHSGRAQEPTDSKYSLSTAMMRTRAQHVPGKQVPVYQETPPSPLDDRQQFPWFTPNYQVLVWHTRPDIPTPLIDVERVPLPCLACLLTPHIFAGE